jgi:phosphoglycolate phosphatase-like HAD superfamily hydrolase
MPKILICKDNYKLGVFTGFNQLSYERLDRFNLLGYFGHIVETTQYREHKLHSEGLLLCIEKLETTAEKVVYIGDGVSDMLAGHAAQVHTTIGITTGFGSGEELRGAGADHIIDSLQELLLLLDTINGYDGS